MRKFLSVVLAVLLIVCTGLTLVGCASSYYDPRGKKWYNATPTPNITYPFREIYDGCYAIQIDKDGNTELQTLNGEVVKGKLSVSFRKKNILKSAVISVEFENGKTATGSCSKRDNTRSLSIYYDGVTYNFTDTRQLSKDEFDAYRAQFTEFLIGVYQTGVFPSETEIENNSLYQKFTNYFQIDPCCGGPFVYDTVRKGTIEKIEDVNRWKELTLTVDGERVVCETESNTFVALIKNGEITELDLSDIKEGECLISYEGSYNIGVIGVFYIETH